MSHYEQYMKDKHTTLLITRDLKAEIEQVSISTGKKLSYPKTLKMLVDFYNQHKS